AEHPVGAVSARRVGVGGGDDLGRLVPACPHEAALAPGAGVAFAGGGVLLDRRPRLDRGHGPALLAPQPHQPAANQRRLHPVGAVEIPAVGGAAGAAARLVVGQIRPGARIIGLLRLPGDDPGLDVDLPGAGAGAVHPVGGAYDLVVLPAPAIGV